MARRRRRSSSTASLVSTSDDKADRPLLPIEEISPGLDKIAYARRKKPEGWRSIAFQLSLVLITLALVAYTYHCFDHFHLNLTHFYAHHLEDQHAQHVLGHKMLKERTNVTAAFHWFRRAADAGHAHSAYNLAAGHLSGFRTDVKKGEVRQLLKFAAKNGVEEAKKLLRTLCVEKPKYCDL